MRLRVNLSGFIDFIRAKGVVGLAIGVIIGFAVNTVVQSMVNDIINPLVGLVLPADNLNKASFNIGDATVNWGNFASALINLIIIAAVVYFVIIGLGLDRLDKKEEKK